MRSGKKKRGKKRSVGRRGECRKTGSVARQGVYRYGECGKHEERSGEVRRIRGGRREEKRTVVWDE